MFDNPLGCWFKITATRVQGKGRVERGKNEIRTGIILSCYLLVLHRFNCWLRYNIIGETSNLKSGCPKNYLFQIIHPPSVFPEK
jgi:hypothetical protein